MDLNRLRKLRPYQPTAHIHATTSVRTVFVQQFEEIPLLRIARNFWDTLFQMRNWWFVLIPLLAWIGLRRYQAERGSVIARRDAPKASTVE